MKKLQCVAGRWIVRALVQLEGHESGIHFFTEHEFLQQPAYMHHFPDYRSRVYTHNSVQRQVMRV